MSGELRSSAWLVILHKGNQSSFQRSSSEPYIVEAIWNQLVALSSSHAPSNAQGRALGVYVNQCGTEQSHWLEQIAWATGHSVVNHKVRMHFPAIFLKQAHCCSAFLEDTKKTFLLKNTKRFYSYVDQKKLSWLALLHWQLWFYLPKIHPVLALNFV